MSAHPNSKKIVLTGASGGLGSAVLKHLEPLVAPSDLVLGLYDLNKAPKKLLEAGAKAFKIDYTDLPSLDKAFQGASIVFLVSYPSIQHQERFQMHKNAIDAAIRQHVQHIFYTSLAFGGNLQTSSLAFVMQAHLSTEAYLDSVSSSLTYTAIREGLYSESYPYYFGFFDPAHPVDEVHLPIDDGAIAFAARDELGEATARMIHAYWRNGPATFPSINQRILLSGPQPVTLSEVGALLGKHLNLGKPIRIRRVSVDEYVQRYRKQAAENKDIRTNIREWATSFDAIKAGETAVVSSTLREWLRREPERFETTLAKLVKQQD